MFTTLPLYHVPLYHVTTLPRCHFTKLPLYHITTLPSYQVTTFLLSVCAPNRPIVTLTFNNWFDIIEKNRWSRSFSPLPHSIPFSSLLKHIAPHSSILSPLSSILHFLSSLLSYLSFPSLLPCWLPGQVLLDTATTGAVPSLFTGILECNLLVHYTILFIAKNEAIWTIITGVIAILVTSVK